MVYSMRTAAPVINQATNPATTTSGGLIVSKPVLPEEVPSDPKELTRLKESMFNNDVVYGKFVSTDGKAALVLAGFNEERLDYGNIHKQIMLIKKAVAAFPA